MKAAFGIWMKTGLRVAVSCMLHSISDLAFHALSHQRKRVLSILPDRGTNCS